MKAYKVRAKIDGLTVIYSLLAADLEDAVNTAKIKAKNLFSKAPEDLLVEEKTKPEEPAKQGRLALGKCAPTEEARTSWPATR